MMKKCIVLLVTLAMVVMGACGGGQEPAVSNEGKQQQQPEQVELVLYSTAATSEEEVKEKFSDPIEAQFPHIKIKYIRKAPGTNIDELMTAGQVIDIYYESVNYFNTVRDFGLNYDMSELIETHNIDLETFEPTMIEYAREMSDNGIYGLPVWSTNVILFYNKDIFDKFAVNYPENGMTWDEFHELSKTLTRNEEGKQYFGFASSPSHTLRANQFSLTFLDPSTDKAAVMADDRWRKLYEAYYITPSSDQSFRSAMQGDESLKGRLPYKDPFLKDRTLATFAYLSDLDWAASVEGVNWDIVSLPTFSELPNVGSQAYPFYWGVTAQSEHKDEAMQVIKFLTDREYQTQQVRSGTMTTLKDEEIKKQFGQDSKYKDKNLSAVFYNEYAAMPVKSMYEAIAQKPYEDGIHEAASGMTDVNTLFRNIEESVNKAVEAAKVTGER